jgi:hypothetical protein
MAKPGRGFSPEAPEGVRFLEPELRLPVLFLAAQVRRLRWHSAATETRHEITAGRDQVPGDDRVARTDAAYDPIASTLPKGAARGPCSAIGANALSKSLSKSRRLWSTA